MGLSACASEAPATGVVMPEMLATMTQDADPGMCAVLRGTNQVKMDLEIVGDEARMQGCVDPMMSAESLTLIYFANCHDNTDIAMCSYSTPVDWSGYFVGTDQLITATTPISVAEVNVGGHVITCEISDVQRGVDANSGTITFNCNVSAPGQGL